MSCSLVQERRQLQKDGVGTAYFYPELHNTMFLPGQEQVYLNH